MNKVKLLKRVGIGVGSLLGVAILTLGGYVSYVLLSYYRIEDNQVLKVDRKSLLEEAETNKEYTITSWNIGFGAYVQDFTFFLDEGFDEEGNPTCGTGSKAKSKESVIYSTNGVIKTIKSLNPDFAMFQEVDTRASRSHFVNQDEIMQDTSLFNSYDHSFAINFHASYLPYPLYDMHGRAVSGLSSFSKYQIQSSIRKQYTVTDSFSKIFDLDRCYSVNQVKVNNGKNLYLINSHMSAYDEGGLIRKAQIKELSDFLNSAVDNNDYFIVSGDYNHDLLTNNPDFPQYSKDNKPFNETKKDPSWLSAFFDEDRNAIIPGFQVIASDNTPTCRNNDIPWSGFDQNGKAKTYTCVVDGFIASNNIQVLDHYNVMTHNDETGLNNFAYSDHDPAVMTFELL